MIDIRSSANSTDLRDQAIGGARLVGRAGHQAVEQRARLHERIAEAHEGHALENEGVQVVERAEIAKAHEAALRRVWVDVVDMGEARRILDVAVEGERVLGRSVGGALADRRGSSATALSPASNVRRLVIIVIGPPVRRRKISRRATTRAIRSRQRAARARRPARGCRRGDHLPRRAEVERPALPVGDRATGAFDHRRQRHEVVGLQPGLDTRSAKPMASRP